jgi:hypothetical protein
MPALVSAIDAQVRQVAVLNIFGLRPVPATFRMRRREFDGSLVSLTDCSRLVRDIVLGVLGGATMGLCDAVAGDFF